MQKSLKIIAGALLASTALTAAAHAADEVKVGIRQSLSGTMAISEVTV
ncbi:urea ABC transporter substrate-binding protein, partial [Thioclava sp. BHET1]